MRLGNVGPKQICRQRAVTESPHERVQQAGLRQVKARPPQHVMEHSALPRHLPKLPLVREDLVEMLLCRLMGVSLGKAAQR
jgi:hypothetical protein